MPGKRGAGPGEGSKKAQGQARKADAAAQKKAAADAQSQAAEDQKWEKGAKDSSKKEAAAAKAAEAARKKAERAALEAEEAASLKSAKTGNAKAAPKKASRGLDDALAGALGQPSNSKAADLNATGIDNALDALSITGSSSAALDRHPERRFKAAYNAFEERRLDEMKDDKTLRKQQKIERIRKEFEKHPDNPFNQLNATYNMTKDEVSNLKQIERERIEDRLASP